MPDVIIFLGPSLLPAEAEAILPPGTEVRYLPPVRRGDLVSAIAAGPRIIGIIDGLFFENAAVGHREILTAIRAGIRVIGASSMGALRAAELAPFGMEGIGEVFRRYRDGSIESDDEVALICDPESNTALSEALINIRITLEHSYHEAILDSDEMNDLLRTAKEQYYPERTWERVIRESGLTPEKKALFRSWLTGNRMDQKGEDARSALIHIKNLLFQITGEGSSCTRR